MPKKRNFHFNTWLYKWLNSDRKAGVNQTLARVQKAKESKWVLTGSTAVAWWQYYLLPKSTIKPSDIDIAVNPGPGDFEFGYGDEPTAAEAKAMTKKVTLARRIDEVMGFKDPYQFSLSMTAEAQKDVDKVFQVQLVDPYPEVHVDVKQMPQTFFSFPPARSGQGLYLFKVPKSVRDPREVYVPIQSIHSLLYVYTVLHGNRVKDKNTVRILKQLQVAFAKHKRKIMRNCIVTRRV